jgi:hypothetical protein
VNELSVIYNFRVFAARFSYQSKIPIITNLQIGMFFFGNILGLLIGKSQFKATLQQMPERQ